MSDPTFTPEDFQRLPLLVPLKTFSAWTGIDRWTVMLMRREGHIRTVKVGGHHRYLKSEIARLCDLPLAPARGPIHPPERTTP